MESNSFRLARFTKSISIESFDDLIKKALKLTVYQYKKCRIRTTFTQYYYGTIFKMFTYKKRIAHAEKTQWGSWFDQGFGVEVE
ncbi:hypothetical protein [Alkalihalobacillus deserti]|uniref:hypothetical protein n=1 Tax=Alkalihalobacillus deserti TaxID=2879466 RepID=UPI001D1461F9|nr:hypothetical protein [Alkalihalobacillus deserti]